MRISRNLIRNQIDSIFNGVNQQPAEQRLPSQVEEMINAYPTINQGILKRNPTTKIPLDDTVDYSNEMFNYNYDRGDVLGEDERYSFSITSAGIEVIDIIDGVVYNEANGKLIYDGSSKTYLTGSFGGSNGYACLTLGDTTFISNKRAIPVMLSDLPSGTSSKRTAFYWIKRADPQYGYTYSWSIKLSGGSTQSGSVEDTNTTDVASKLASGLNGVSGVTATANGAVVKVTATSNIELAKISDTYGSQASSSWIDEISNVSDLPLNFPFGGEVFKVVGTAGTKSPFYVVNENNVWKETINGTSKYKINRATMPHVLVRNANDTFIFKQWDGWANRTVGDDEITPLPSFLVGNTTIKDIFFLKNRLGFITESSVVLSETSQFGNFFRTTALSLLDSDPIDVTINSTQLVNLEYAVNMEDSLMLTSEKMQFRLRDTDILTPNTISFIPSSAYEININIRPLFLNNRVFFVVKRGEYSAVVEFYVSSQTNTIAGNDITAHCQSYIDGEVDRFSGSAINNMLFLSKSGSDTVFVYKYYDSGNERIQSAWFKWQFNGNIYSTFSMGKKLYVLINRKDAEVQENWILADGTWDEENVWSNTALWIMDSSYIGTINQIESLNVFPQDYTNDFFDNGDTLINANILFGRWVPSMGGEKDFSAICQFKTVQVQSATGSFFNLYVLDINRDTIRRVKEVYTINRRPMVFGNVKNIKIGIESRTEKGFKINGIAFEGTVNTRSRRA